MMSLFELQSKNVQFLKQVRDNLYKEIKHHKRKNDVFQLEIKSKIFSLLFSAWSEAQFTQILNTPNAFTQEEIKTIAEGKNIITRWEAMIKMAFDKSSIADKDTKFNNIKNHINKYIKPSSEIRNKIAHGQWKYALNGKLKAESTEYTLELANIDPVKINNLFEIHIRLGFIVRDLVQSPNKATPSLYDKHYRELDDFINKCSAYSIDTIHLKPILPRNNT